MRTTKTPMYSDIFDDIWVCGFYANGRFANTQNFVSFFIQICIWPAYTKELHATWKVKCEETGDVYTPSAAFVVFSMNFDFKTDTNGQSKGKRKWFPSSKFNDFKSITFTVDVEIIDHVLIDMDDNEHEITNPMELAQMLNSCRESYANL